ncbi:hypothetical protein [Arthrobacter bambusae]|uniref:Uncharacterized protein n=1 Tax=Arthrobacter bambusae TaxID=1338426 RepID=A0AAW8D8Z9_9MICC|nr:hypothetical protein [Arthrobacter bambusae]MDP9904762.1 hypothetical protein [Arthrobacter bambusae]MDQ0129578.1 hypothetical protein [Arthrobacter bambusae]MDQ0180809.1 hypothetical protein [Arthrobacter bambusae]
MTAPNWTTCPNCGEKRDSSGRYTSPANQEHDRPWWAEEHLSGKCTVHSATDSAAEENSSYRRGGLRIVRDMRAPISEHVAYHVEETAVPHHRVSVEPLTETSALQLMRDLGSPYPGQRYDHDPWTRTPQEPTEASPVRRFNLLKDRLIASTGSPGLTSFHDGKVHMTLGEWERLIGAVEATRTSLEEIQRICGAAEYKIPGRHETWDAYHEGRSSLAGEIETVLDRLGEPSKIQPNAQSKDDAPNTSP